MEHVKGLTGNEVVALFHEADHRDEGHGCGRANHTHLGRNRGSRHRTFRTHTVFNRDVVDNREHRVNGMTRTAQNRQEPAKIRSQVANKARMFTQELFGNLQ